MKMVGPGSALRANVTFQGESFYKLYGDVAQEMMNPASTSDVFAHHENMAIEVYETALEYSSMENVPCLSCYIEIGPAKMNVVLRVVDRESVRSVLTMFVDRARDLGLQWSLDEFRLPIVDANTAITRLKASENGRARARAAEYHAGRSANLYLAGKRSEARMEAERAYKFASDIPARGRTNVGYVFLSEGELDIAEELIRRDMDLQSPPLFPALAFYDLAVIDVRRRNFLEALAHLEQSIGALAATNATSVMCGRLYGIGENDGNVALTEVQGQSADLVKVAHAARVVIGKQAAGESGRRP